MIIHTNLIISTQLLLHGKDKGKLPLKTGTGNEIRLPIIVLALIRLVFLVGLEVDSL